MLWKPVKQISKKKYKDLFIIYLYFLLFLQLSYFYLINDILYNSTKEKYFNFSIYVNLIKIFLPKILKSIFKNDNVPKYFIQKIDEIFKIWRNRWNLFDNKYFQGLFIYTYNFNSSQNIEKYYEDYIQNEINKFWENIHDSQKIKLMAFENGLDTDCDFSEIIIDLQKIKKMELLINLSKDIDGNEFSEINYISEKETSKIQRILKNMNENFNANNDKNNNGINKINFKDKINIKDNNINLDEKKTNVNNENGTFSSKKLNENEPIYDDLDGEPI